MRPPKAPGIADRIEHEIRSGERAPGSFAPSVRHLMAHDAIASGTARKVHEVLRQRGLIRPVVSLGAIVTDPECWVSSVGHTGDDPELDDSLVG